MNRLKKEKKIRWSIILLSNGKIPELTDCLQNLVTAVPSSKTEIILVNNSSRDIVVSLGNYFCKQEDIDFSSFTHSCSHVTSEIIEETVKNAKGEFIVFLNEDTIVSKNFLSRMLHAYENFPIEYGVGPIGCVVPVSNNAPARQKISLPSEVISNDVGSIQSRIEKSLTDNPDELKWVISGTASDFCMMVPKIVIQEIGPLDYSIGDEVTRGSDFVLRLLSYNYYTLICGNVYTYRNDSILVRNDPKLPTDLPPNRDEKLGFLFKIRVDTEHLMEVFVYSLKKAVELADGIFVLDEGSKIKVGRHLKDKEPELWKKITKYDKTFEVRDDKSAYNKLLDWAEQAGMTWTFSLESGEVLEGRATREYFEKLMHPINPTVICYTSNEFYFWDDMISWRSDGHWGKINSVRFSRLIPGRRLMGNDRISSQCGYVAPLPPEVIRPMNIRIKCYDLMDELHRSNAYKRAMTLTKGQNWNHIKDSNGMVSYPWQNNVTVSVYSPTNKGGEELLSWLDHVWSWSDEIVVGNDSAQLTTGDLKALKTWGAKVVPCLMSDDYSKGRNMIIKECTKDFIFQLDLDERLVEPMMIFRMLSTDHDAWMFSIDNIQREGKPIVTETARLFRNKGKPQYWGYLHETIDDHMKKNAWKVGLAPVKLTHYGYLNMNPQSAWTKMQRYMRINLKQMKDFPEDSRSYYNLALHLVEDNLVEDAMKLLITACYLSSGLILPVTELAKLHIVRSLDLFNLVATSGQGGASSMFVKEYSKQMFDALTQIRPQNQVVSPGHARAFFDTNPEQRLWLYNHLQYVENNIIKPRQTGVVGNGKDKKVESLDNSTENTTVSSIQKISSLDKPNLTLIKS